MSELPDLPETPVVMWHEERSAWPFLGALLLLFPFVASGAERVGAVEVSVNGLSITGGDFRPPRPSRSQDGRHFVSWSEIESIRAADPPDLAVIQLVGGSEVVLGPNHLPLDEQRERDHRLDLLVQGLAVARRGDRATGGSEGSA